MPWPLPCPALPDTGPARLDVRLRGGVQGTVFVDGQHQQHLAHADAVEQER